jgi:hypothetical protein
MSDLHALQTELAQALMSVRPSTPAPLQGDALADAKSRLFVYQRGYRLRLREALATEFPGLALMMGRRFTSMLDDYVRAHPSSHYNIRWHGAGLATFLEQAMPWREQPAWAEMAKLDWAISTAFDAADEVGITVADLSGVPQEAWAELRLHPLNHLHWVMLTCNAEAFRRAADQGAGRPRLRRLDQARHVVVWRPSLDVRYRRVKPDELSVLRGMAEGESFSELCERLASQHVATSAPERMVGHLMRWLGEGLVGRCDLPANAIM